MGTLNFNSAVITGSAGFIGFHVCKFLLKQGITVLGIDNFNDYYDVGLKRQRNQLLKEYPLFELVETDISDFESCDSSIARFMSKHSIKSSSIVLINLAAQAGVRYSIDNPHAYIQSNIVGFSNILEICRKLKPYNFLFASSSSVYGLNTKLPFDENDSTDHPMSLYAATKKSNEVMAHSYSHLYDIPTIGMRFFTVYGPYGRPDMALFKFAHAIVNSQPLNVFNNGDMVRDFTYIDDVVNSICLLANKPVEKTLSTDTIANNRNLPSSQSYGKYKIFNIGQGKPIPLMKYISTLEAELAQKANIKLMPMQDGDVRETSASSDELFAYTNYRPNTSVEEGIKRFVQWYNIYIEKR